MSARNISRIALILAISATFAQPAAFADTPEDALQAAPVSVGNHCVMLMNPLEEGDATSATTDLGCYDSFSAAIGAATRGAAVLPEWTSPETITEADVAESAVYLIGIDYDGLRYNGASQSWFTTNPDGCFFGNIYTANQPAVFNNRLSSTRGFSGCRKNQSFDGYYQTGSWVLCGLKCSLRGHFMNNRTSSKRWWR